MLFSLAVSFKRGFGETSEGGNELHVARSSVLLACLLVM